MLRVRVFSASDEPWADCIHANSVWPFRFGKGLREMDDPGLGNCIGQRMRSGSNLVGMHGRDADDMPLLVFPHRRKYLLTAQNGAGQIAVEDPVPFAGRGFEERLVQKLSHIVDQNLNRSAF